MGYKYILNAEGKPEMTWDPDPTIATDLLFSTMIEKGAFFLNPEFGREKEPAKITDDVPSNIKTSFKDSVQWLLNNGRASEITVEVQPDSQNKTRMNVQVAAKQANEEPAKFETFVGLI